MTGKGFPKKKRPHQAKPQRETRPPAPRPHRDARPPREAGELRQKASQDRQQSANQASIYGVLPVLETLRANASRIDRIIVADTAREKRLADVLDLAHREGVRIDRLPRAAFERIVDPTVNHQGIAAFAAAADYVDVDEILENPNEKEALVVVLDGIEDPRNLGAILRSVECAGADGVVIPERRAVGLTDTVAKASAGATEHVRVAKVTNLNRFINDLKERNIWVVGAAGEAEMSYTDWDWSRPTALVLGSEGSGLHRLVAENCDVLVKVPMYGKIGSLNVSVAAGVLLFEARRQRSKKD